MDITIFETFLPHDDQAASLAFYRDILGFEVRNDVEYGGMHWITVGPANQPGTSIVQEPTEQPYGRRDCAVRDPSGNLIRINELR
jgi:catechol 2,3-dioxygenase-like lactoylglutathione lyase family enzyme